MSAGYKRGHAVSAVAAASLRVRECGHNYGQARRCRHWGAERHSAHSAVSALRTGVLLCMSIQPVQDLLR